MSREVEAAPVIVGPIFQEVDNLDSTLNSILELTDRLENVFAPILGPPPTDDNDKAVPVANSSQLAHRLSLTNNMADTIRFKLLSIIERRDL